MSSRILLITHAPLAHALRECALHVFADCGDTVLALDVHPNAPPEESLAAARSMLAQSGSGATLVLSDIFGATPCNVAQRLVEGVRASADPGQAESMRLLVGVNLPMLLRAITYRHEGMEAWAARALTGGAQGVMPVAITAPQNQNRRTAASPNDQEHHHHQQ